MTWNNTSESENRLFNGDTSTSNNDNSTYLDMGSTYSLSNVNLLTIDYGTPTCVDGYKFYGNNANQGGASNPTGKFQGSNNNSDWTDLKTISNNLFAVSGTGTTEELFTNNSAYRYYRWLGTSGSCQIQVGGMKFN